MLPPACCDTKRRKTASLSDSGKRVLLHFKTQQLISIVDLDKCVFQQETSADFLVRAEAHDVIVELKGKQVLHALDQVAETVRKLRLLIQMKQKTSAIVFAKSVPRTNTTIQSKKNSLLHQEKIAVRISSSDAEFHFE